MAINRISTSCWADPFPITRPLHVLELYEYSPLVIEASILNNEKSVQKSTEQIKDRLVYRQAGNEDNKARIERFLRKRRNFLSNLLSVSEVESFVRFTVDKAEEVKKSQAEVKEYLAGIGAIQDLQKELFRVVRSQFKRRTFLLDAIRRAISSGNGKLKESLVNYVRAFNTELRGLVMEGAKSETVYTILAADVQFIATQKRLLRTAQSLAIPLDISPLRLSLAILEEPQFFEQSRKYYPPCFCCSIQRLMRSTWQGLIGQ